MSPTGWTRLRAFPSCACRSNGAGEKAQATPKLAGWFVGQVMKATGGRANPKAVNEIVTARLGL